jgi:hypothetical protein
MPIRDTKFDEFTLLDKISKINMTNALARFSASASRRINKVDETAYLGLIVDSSHIDKLKKKTISFVGVLGRIKNAIAVCSRLVFIMVMS